MYNTYFHRMDGAVELLLFIFCMTLTFLFFDFRVLLFLFFIGCIGLVVAKIPFRKIFIVFSVIFTFSLLNSVMILFITPSHGSELTGSYTSFMYIVYATITYETLFYTATLSLKYFTLLPFTLILIYTTNPSEFVSSLSKFRVHYKIIYAINIALRYIPDIQSEYKVIKHAQEARGVAFEKGEASLWIRMKNRILIFWPLIIHSLERIDTVSNAMDLRGFGKKNTRTWFYTNKANSGDFIALFMGVFILITAVYLKLHVFQNFWYPF
ncbi:energy-coupling factor transporter transmembrane protein EcfT [Bacillus anthracis]|uniref:energy-coupling factor transporter transmembrane component T family protein n=1 Tax=Bacillus anthracis TaxID=1392 RepID=UPI0018F60D65|nr:energy-coupling factor transporter transmembrane component T [Bacillus anthracis]MBJ7912377.1 energy-coupling factor transporter transmembrane protein EcfT [Bacillus anthracis]